MTAQKESVKKAPAAEILEYVARTFGKDHCTVRTGVEKVEKALMKNFKERDERIHTGCKVVGIIPGSVKGLVDLKVEIEGNDEETQTFEAFHHVILATQANQSSKFLDAYVEALTSQDQNSSSSRNEKEIERLGHISRKLKAFKYETSVVINHTDRSLLPEDEKDWRDLNLVSPSIDQQLKQDQLRINTSTQSSRSHCQSPKRVDKIGQARRNEVLDLDSPSSTEGSGSTSSSSPSFGWSYSAGTISETETEMEEGAPEESRKGSLHRPSLNASELKQMILKLDSCSENLKNGNHTMATHIIQSPASPLTSSFSLSSSSPSSSRLLEAYNGPLLMQTTNALPGLGPRPELVLSVTNFDRVVLSQEGKNSQSGLYDFGRKEGTKERKGWTFAKAEDWEMKLGELQGVGKSTEDGSKGVGIWVCGSWGPGIPLLEGCVKTARLVCEELINTEELEFESKPW